MQDLTLYAPKMQEQQRATLRHEGKNAASLVNGAYVSTGNNVSRPLDLLRDVWYDYTNMAGYASAPLNPTFNTTPWPTKDGVIHVVLSQGYLLNTIRFLLLDTDNRAYSYELQVSSEPVCSDATQTQWQTLAVLPLVTAQSWQTVTFPETLIHQLRLVGISATGAATFDVVKLFAFNDLSLNPLPGNGVLPAYR